MLSRKPESRGYLTVAHLNINGIMGSFGIRHNGGVRVLFLPRGVMGCTNR